jgi:hypothetical protein
MEPRVQGKNKQMQMKYSDSIVGAYVSIKDRVESQQSSVEQTIYTTYITLPKPPKKWPSNMISAVSASISKSSMSWSALRLLGDLRRL